MRDLNKSSAWDSMTHSMKKTTQRDNKKGSRLESPNTGLLGRDDRDAKRKKMKRRPKRRRNYTDDESSLSAGTRKKSWRGLRALIVGDSRVRDWKELPGFDEVRVISENGCSFRQALKIIKDQLKRSRLNFNLVIAMVGHCEITKKVFDKRCLQVGCKDPVWYSVLKDGVSARRVVSRMVRIKRRVEARFPDVTLRFTTFPPVDMVKFNLRQEKKKRDSHIQHIDWTTWDDVTKEGNPRLRYALLISDVRELQLKFGKKYFLDIWPAFASSGDLTALANGKVDKRLFTDYLHFSKEGNRSLMTQLALTVKDIVE